METTKQTAMIANVMVKVIKPIIPELLEIAGKGRKFSVNIGNDGDGVHIKIGVCPMEEDVEVREVESVEELDLMEKQMLKSALTKAKGNIRKAAEICGISERNFRKRMLKLNVEE